MSRLPAETEIIIREQNDDIYGIGPGLIHCHPFQIPQLSGIQITLTHSAKNSQDHSLRYWFSLEPMGDSIYPSMYNRGFFHADRYSDTWILWDENCINPKINTYGPTCKNLWLNIQNLQNSTNGYHLIFDLDIS